MSNMPGNNNAQKQPTVGAAGRRVGEWVLLDLIGGGAFGEVWKARHHVWADQLAAVKLPTDPQYVRALQREGTHAHRLEHPNIVRPLGFDPFAETPYLVMEYVPGRDLRGLLRDWGRLSAADATSVMNGVLSALKVAHGKGIVHRDVKPENILIHERGLESPGGLAEQGVVKVTDFGLGQASNDAERAHGGGSGGTQSIVFSTDAGDAQSRQIAGSFDYMAPEQRGGGDVDGQADLYACGVVLYEMLTGERPAGTDVPSDLNANVPPRLDEAFRRSYARLERRFADADEFLTALAKPEQKTVSPPPPLPAKVGATAPGSCPACRGRVDKGDQFCMHCGHQLAGLIRRCGKCGAFPAADDAFCMFCGQDLKPRGPTALIPRLSDVTA